MKRASPEPAMRLPAFGFAFAMLIAPHAGAAVDTDGSLAKLPPADRAALETGLNQILYDGETARIYDLRANANRQGCGFVNSKGLQGGYTGYRIFSFDLSKGLVLISERPPAKISEYELPQPDLRICDAVGHK